MKSNRRAAAPPPKPLVIFDGDCAFCRRWIVRWKRATGERVDYWPFQDPRVREQFPELPREVLATAVHLIEPDGAVCSGAEAAFRARAYHPDRQRLWRWYRRSPVFARLAESAYRCVARHRAMCSRLLP